MPKRDVLEPDERRSPHDAREAADAFRHLRVPLVRHCRRTLHSLAERLFHLAHLGAGEVADLGREALERCRAEGKRRQQFRVAVARDDLRRERVRLEPEPLAREPLDLRFDLRVRADGAGELTDAIRLECRDHARAGAVELERPAGELPAERRRLGMDTV